MAHSFISSYFHLVWSTRQRIKLIRPEKQQRLYQYLSAIARNHKMKCYAIGGMADHIHILASLPSDLAPAKAINILKANSSKWMREEDRRFGWQEGYGAFTVSASNVSAVCRYIETQEQHHRRRTFEDEFIALLDKHGVEYNLKYVFD
ncbi:MAG: IS200/IS605 family transposase [Acidobacteriales bacterium]|nr:IS200/IS605 family transposase [Terriglobales bacterium]